MQKVVDPQWCSITRIELNLYFDQIKDLWKQIQIDRKPMIFYDVLIGDLMCGDLCVSRDRIISIRENEFVSHYISDQLEEMLSCPNCYGQCYKICSLCQGSGILECDLGHEHDCEDCYGDGYDGLTSGLCSCITEIVSQKHYQELSNLC